MFSVAGSESSSYVRSVKSVWQVKLNSVAPSAQSLSITQVLKQPSKTVFASSPLSHSSPISHIELPHLKQIDFSSESIT
jgi:hypothetical protein